jgi:uncharacterized protein (TIGR03067 family)
MKTKLMVLLVILPLAGAAAPAPKDDDAKEELKKFEGTWKLVAANLGGMEATPEHVENTSLVVSGHEFTMTIGTEVHKGKFTIDPSKKPKTIDVEFTEGSLKDSKVQGIYEIKGDTRKSCFAEPNADRPADFTGGKDKFVWEWKREKP